MRGLALRNPRSWLIVGTLSTIPILFLIWSSMLIPPPGGSTPVTFMGVAAVVDLWNLVVFNPLGAWGAGTAALLVLVLMPVAMGSLTPMFRRWVHGEKSVPGVIGEVEAGGSPAR